MRRAKVAAVVTIVVVFGVAVVWSSHRDRIRVSGTVIETATFGGTDMCAGLDYGRENLVFTEPGGTTHQALEVPLSDEMLVSNDPCTWHRSFAAELGRSSTYTLYIESPPLPPAERPLGSDAVFPEYFKGPEITPAIFADGRLDVSWTSPGMTDNYIEDNIKAS
jgi:hypothetical protein